MKTLFILVFSKI